MPSLTAELQAGGGVRYIRGTNPTRGHMDDKGPGAPFFWVMLYAAVAVVVLVGIHVGFAGAVAS